MENAPVRKTLVFIVGPTGSGKTDLSITVAKYFAAPIISADSRQIFEGMAIGTAQPTAEQLAEVEHHFIATHDITEHYTCGRYENDALALLDELFADNDIVIGVGGSGLYVDALCDGMDAMPDIDPKLRESLVRRLEENGIENLLEELRELDPVHYEQMDRSNPQRVIRALEVSLQTGMPYSDLRSGQKRERAFSVVRIGTSVPREQLYDRINRRVDMMIAEGLEDEARLLHPKKNLNSLQTVGYRELFQYFDGDIARDEAVELIKRNSRRYAKRQMTWFGRDQRIAWFPPSETNEIISHIEGNI